jgi:small ligand-binding sensory domain FIST
MKWSSKISDATDFETAIRECLSGIEADLAGQPDILIAFISPDFQPSYQNLPGLIYEYFPKTILIGCSGNGVIGNGVEVEHRAGVALTGAEMSDVSITPFHITDSELPDGDESPEKWESLFKVKHISEPKFIILSDPFSVEIQNLVNGMDYAFPNSTIIGGIASGGSQQGTNAIYLNRDTFESGVVGIALHGDIEIDTIVAQGCKPIGNLMNITGCERNILTSLDNKPPFEVLSGIYNNLSNSDQQLFQHSLFMGVVNDPFIDVPNNGDFLIRNIVGGNPEEGKIAIGEILKEGQLVQFHLRDSNTSSENLKIMLEDYKSDQERYDQFGALLFSCLGRGSYLYGKADHDTNMFKALIGEIPLTGFFCNGEIGPVGDTTYIHGYTSSFGIIKPKK